MSPDKRAKRYKVWHRERWLRYVAIDKIDYGHFAPSDGKAGFAG